MEIMKDKTVIIVSAVVGFLGVLSAILAFSAEGTKLTISEGMYTIYISGDYCIYPPSPSMALAICAAIFLMMAQITVSAVSGCCKSRAIPSENKRIIGVICAVASWIASVIAWGLLINGAEWNANVVRETAPVCYYLKDGIFAGAGILCLAAAALGITSFIMMRSQQQAAAATPAPVVVVPNFKPAPDGIAMGHPQSSFPLPQGHAQV